MVAGGLGGDGAQANAITFMSGANSLAFAGPTSGLSGAIGVLGGGSVTFVQDEGATTTVDNVITGNGSVAMTGGGTIVLTGTNTYSGGTSLLGRDAERRRRCQPRRFIRRADLRRRRAAGDRHDVRLHRARHHLG